MIADTWRAQCEALAEWADARLVNRRDVWGQYIPTDRRTDPDRKLFTAPAVDRRGVEFLTVEQLVRHFCGGPVLGTHSTSAAEWSRWGAFDLDAHDGDRGGTMARGARLVATLRERGAQPLVTESCDRGGLHLRVLLAEPVPTRDVFAWLQSVKAAAGVSCETFPKQAHLPTGGFGNWLRLPGRHHTRDHWTRVAEARRWLTGRHAVAALLEHPTTAAARVPPAPIIVVRLASPALALPDDPSRRAVRVERYLEALPTGQGVGTGRSDAAFLFARFLVHTIGLSDAEAQPWLETWNGRNAVPLPATKLEATLTNARRYCRRGPAPRPFRQRDPFARCQLSRAAL